MSIHNSTDASFVQDVLDKEGVQVVQFWASWCMPCRKLSPVIEELSESFDQVGFHAVNVDENPKTSQQYGIRSIPNIKVFIDGEVVADISGLHAKQDYISAITQAQDALQSLN